MMRASLGSPAVLIRLSAPFPQKATAQRAFRPPAMRRIAALSFAPLRKQGSPESVAAFPAMPALVPPACHYQQEAAARFREALLAEVKNLGPAYWLILWLRLWGTCPTMVLRGGQA